MAGEEPPYLTVGTDVSAKYKGAFCEAKIKKVTRSVKCKITFKNNNGSALVIDDQVRGTLRVGSHVEARHPEKNQFLEGVINKLHDYSQYTVVFDDGDETTLRRTSLCLKSGRHFAESETLDQLPLTHPEHFGTPVMGVKGGRKRRSLRRSPALDDGSSEEEPPVVRKKETKPKDPDPDMGKVVCVDTTDKKKQKDNWFPALVVSPGAQDVRVKTKTEYLIRSFKDGKYHVVTKKDTREFSREIGSKVDNNSLKTAVERAMQYVEKDDLPPHWDRGALFVANLSSNDENSDQDSDSDSSNDEQSEEKDRFVAQLYKFMDDRGTPINKAPTVSNRHLNLHKLFRVVRKMGGYHRVTNQFQWKTVYTKMRLPTYNSSSSFQIKQAYKKYLYSFEFFESVLGCTMGTSTRSGRGRSLMMARDRDREFKAVGRRKREPKTDKQDDVTAKSKQDESEQVEETAKPQEDEKEEEKTDKPEEELEETKAADVVEEVIEKKEKPLERKIKEEKEDQGSDAGEDKSEDRKSKNQTKGDDSKSEESPSPKRRGRKKIIKTEKREDDEKLHESDDDEEYPIFDVNILVGDRVKVKYGRGRQQKIYEAKVLKTDEEETERIYFVHYTGWNMRYDEWVKKHRIVENLTQKISGKRMRQFSSKGPGRMGGKRGRPHSGGPSTSKTSLISSCGRRGGGSATRSRITRSDRNSLLDSPFANGLGPRKRARKSSRHGGASGVNADDSSDDTESESGGSDSDIFIRKRTRSMKRESGNEDLDTSFEDKDEQDEDMKKSDDEIDSERSVQSANVRIPSRRERGSAKKECSPRGYKSKRVESDDDEEDDEDEEGDEVVARKTIVPKPQRKLRGRAAKLPVEGVKEKKVRKWRRKKVASDDDDDEKEKEDSEETLDEAATGKAAAESEDRFNVIYGFESIGEDGRNTPRDTTENASEDLERCAPDGLADSSVCETPDPEFKVETDSNVGDIDVMLSKSTEPISTGVVVEPMSNMSMDTSVKSPIESVDVKSSELDLSVPSPDKNMSTETFVESLLDPTIEKSPLDVMETDVTESETERNAMDVDSAEVSCSQPDPVSAQIDQQNLMESLVENKTESTVDLGVEDDDGLDDSLKVASDKKDVQNESSPENDISRAINDDVAELKAVSTEESKTPASDALREGGDKETVKSEAPVVTKATLTKLETALQQDTREKAHEIGKPEPDTTTALHSEEKGEKVVSESKFIEKQKIEEAKKPEADKEQVVLDRFDALFEGTPWKKSETFRSEVQEKKEVTSVSVSDVSAVTDKSESHQHSGGSLASKSVKKDRRKQKNKKPEKRKVQESDSDDEESAEDEPKVKKRKNKEEVEKKGKSEPKTSKKSRSEKKSKSRKGLDSDRDDSKSQKKKVGVEKSRRKECKRKKELSEKGRKTREDERAPDSDDASSVSSDNGQKKKEKKSRKHKTRDGTEEEKKRGKKSSKHELSEDHTSDESNKEVHTPAKKSRKEEKAKGKRKKEKVKELQPSSDESDSSKVSSGPSIEPVTKVQPVKVEAKPEPLGIEATECDIPSYLMCEEDVPASPVGADTSTTNASVEDKTKEGPISIGIPSSSLATASQTSSFVPLSVSHKHESDPCVVLVNTPPTTPESNVTVVSDSAHLDRVSPSASASPCHDTDTTATKSSHGTSPSASSGDDTIEQRRQQIDAARKTEEHDRGDAVGDDHCETDDKMGAKGSKLDAEDVNQARKRKKTQKKHVTGGGVDLSKSVGSPGSANKQKHTPNKPARSTENEEFAQMADMFLGAANSSLHQSSTVSMTVHDQPQSILAPRSPRPSKFNFYVELDEYLDGSERIAILQDKLTELRRTYLSLKAELACIDRRRKKLKRKEKEAASTATSSGSSIVECS